MDKLEEKIASLEALLFIHGEPIETKKIEKVLGLVLGESEELIEKLSESLQADARGLRLIYDDSKVQMVTKPQFNKILESFIKEELAEDLTPASLEVLSIVSYLGPIGRSRIEYLRGVNSMFTLRSLLVRGLIARFPDPKRTNAYLYKPSFELVRHLGLSKIEELGEYEKFNAIVKSFEVEREAIPTAAEKIGEGAGEGEGGNKNENAS